VTGPVSARWTRRGRVAYLATADSECEPPTWYFLHNNLGYSLNQLCRHEDIDEQLDASKKAVETARIVGENLRTQARKQGTGA
jgi:hypothetical protein